ncbi:MAG: hypothetical protein O2887_01400 [Bacteroidetes bacterium]|nr:hypothetical protein [Bacteroidota bacterium]MDA1119145.1 hypothetical protein [Bacteroidota bacterium]
MFIPFEKMPKNGRVWIYQANRELSLKESAFAIQESESFCEQWAAHGHQLNCSCQLTHNRFLVLAVDESIELPSGCSIDSSVHLVRHLEKSLGIDFFDRTNIPFLKDGDVFIEPLPDIRTKIQQGTITSETLTFNNLVPTISAFENSWMVPAKDTWLKKYFS